MKTTLIVIQNEADHADAKKLIEKLMGSSDSQDRARMVAQARLVEAYERTEWPRTAPSLPVLLAYLMDQHSLSRADLVPLLGTASRVQFRKSRAQTTRACSLLLRLPPLRQIFLRQRRSGRLVLHHDARHSPAAGFFDRL